MLGKLLTKVFGSRNDRTLKNLGKIVIQINALEADYEKLSDEKRLALEERGLVLREDMTEAEIQVLNRNMQLSEDRLELEKTSMANTEAARAFEQSMALADRTGFYVGLDGTLTPTMASRTADREFKLREQGLDIEAERLRISSGQFNESLKQQITEFAATHDLNLRETEALIARTEADIAAQSARLAQEIAQADEGNKINWESLRLRGVEIETGKDATEEEMVFRREQLQLQIEQQNLDRANDASQFAESLDLSLAEFESAQERWETEWQFSSEMAAKEFGLKEEEFLMLKWQIEQDIELKGKSLEEASAQWAAEFGLDEEQVRQAMEFADKTFDERVRTIGLENDLTEAQSDALAAELAKFNKEEQRRDTMWEDVLGDKIDWDNEDDVKKFAAHMALINGTGIGGQGGAGLFAPEPGIIESITEFGMDWLIKEYGDETANIVRGKLGDTWNTLFGNDEGDDEGDFDPNLVYRDDEGKLRWRYTDKLWETGDGDDDDGTGKGKVASVVGFAGKYLGVAPTYTWDPSKSYVQNVLTGNPKMAQIGAKIAPYLGPVAVVVGTAIAAYKTWEFYGGALAERWKSKGIAFPRQYSKNFYPPNPVDKDGDPANIGSQPGLYIHWADGVARWTAAGGKGGTKGTYDEPIDEFMARTGRTFMSTEPLIGRQASPSGEIEGEGAEIHAQMLGYAAAKATERAGGESAEQSPWGWDEFAHYDEFVGKDYEDLSDRNKSRLDRLALGVALGLSTEDMLELKLTEKYFPETMVVDPEGILFFDQDFEKGTFKRSYYAETNVTELADRTATEG